MDRGKIPSAGRGAKSKAPQHPQDIFALGGKSTVVVNRDAEKRNIHKPSTSGECRQVEVKLTKMVETPSRLILLNLSFCKTKFRILMIKLYLHNLRIYLPESGFKGIAIITY